MKKFLSLVVTITLVLAVAVPYPILADEDEVLIVAKSGKHNLAISLPQERYRVTTNEDFGETTKYIYIVDAEGIGNVGFFAWTYNEPERTFPDPGAWTMDALLDLREKNKDGYNEGFGATEDESKRQILPVTLGSGEGATLIRTELMINGNRRQIALMYFERVEGDRRVWFQFFIANSGRFANLDDSLSLIAKGINYITSPLSAEISG